jgi:hypothetical protein
MSMENATRLRFNDPNEMLEVLRQILAAPLEKRVQPMPKNIIRDNIL